MNAQRMIEYVKSIQRIVTILVSQVVFVATILFYRRLKTQLDIQIRKCYFNRLAAKCHNAVLKNLDMSDICLLLF